MPRKHLTDITVRTLPVPDAGQESYWCDQVPGFGVRVSCGGAKTFVIKKNNRRKTIGRYPEKKLQEARREARRLLLRPVAGPTMPFGELVEHFFAVRCTLERNRQRTIDDYKRLLSRHFLPVLKDRQLSEIRRGEIKGLIDKLVRNGTPSEANHAHVAIRAVLRFAVSEQLVEANAMDGMQLPARRGTRSRVLGDDELALAYRAAQRIGFPFGTIVLLLILTGQRRSEIGGLRWTYIDNDRQTVTLPGSVTKNGREHTFPYGDLSAAALDEIAAEGDHVFASRVRSGKVFAGWAKGKRVLDGECPIGHWTLHDLRRTFSTIHARIGTPPHITERILNHQVGTLTPIAKIYNRYSYLNEMREAMLNYEREVSRILSVEKPQARVYSSASPGLTGQHRDAP